MKHLKSLILKSKLAHDAFGEEKKCLDEFIAKAFEELNGIKGIEPILKVVSNSNDLKIIFDFNRDSIEEMIATVNEGKREVEVGRVYIAAKGLMKSEDRSGPLCSFAQDLCRYAMELVYRNQSKPYNDHHLQVDNSLSQVNKIYLENHEPNAEFSNAVEKIKNMFGGNLEFEEVLQASKAEETTEPNISRVFLYPKDEQHAELIARVPYFIVAYKENQEKLIEIKRTFSKLFDFYETRTLLDLEREIPILEARQEVRELNELIGYSAGLGILKFNFVPEALNFEFDTSRVTVITSNCTVLTTRMIHQQLSQQENFESSYIFIRLEMLKSVEVFDLTVNALSVFTRPTAIIDCANATADEISEIADSIAQKFLEKADNSKEKFVEQRVVYIQRHETFSRYGAAHFILTQALTQLTEETQTMLLKLQIIFQGDLLQLQDILTIDCPALRLIPLNDLVHGNINIGKPVEFDDVHFHIERKFLPVNGFEINSDELLKSMDRNKNKVSLLTAEPGMGKTSELKSMAMKLKKLFPSRWIVFIDLKELEIAFKRERKISKVNKTSDELSRFFSEKVLKIVGFEAKVFSRLLNENQVIFLMDGIDEASPGFNQFSLNLITSIKEKTSNRLWISTRPYMEEELKTTLNAVSYNLLPLTIYDQKEFLTKSFKVKNIEGAKLDEKLKAIERFLKTLEENSYTDSSSNPIVLGCIVEIFENDQDAQPTEINLYTVFDCFVQKKIGSYMKKINFPAKEPIPSLLTESMNALRFHHRHALKTMFSHTCDEQTIQDCFKENTQPPFADMASVGLINFDNNKTIQFAHRTIAEFFVADFMFKKIFLANKFPASEKRNLFSSFFTSKRTMAMFVLFREIFERRSSNFKMIRIFLDCKLKNFLSEVNTVYIKRVESIILKTFSEQELQNVFRLAVEDGLVNIVYVLSGNSFWVTKESLNGTWIQARSGQNEGSQNAVMIALERQPVKYIDKLLMRARGAFESEVFKKAFRQVDDVGRNIFHCAVANKMSPEVFDFLLNYLKGTLTEKETKDLLLAKEKFGNNFMMSILVKQNVRNFQTILKTVESNFGREIVTVLLTNLDSSGRNLFHYVPKWIHSAKDVETIWTSLKGTFTDVEMREMFCETDEFNQTPMAHAVSECDDETFKTFKMLFKEIHKTNDERREAIFHESNEGFTAFHYGARNKCKEVFMYILHAYKILLTEDELKTVILRDNYEGENILFLSFRGSLGNIATLEVLWSFMKELFDKETLQKLLDKKNYIGKTVAEVIKNEVDYEDKMRIFKTIDE